MIRYDLHNKVILHLIKRNILYRKKEKKILSREEKKLN